MNADKTNYDLLTIPARSQRLSGDFDRWEKRSERARAEARLLFGRALRLKRSGKNGHLPRARKKPGLLNVHPRRIWRSLDKKRFSFVAPALANAGITVAVPDYALCPTCKSKTS